MPKKEINLYVGMTEMQRKWYRMLLEKDIDAVNGESRRALPRVLPVDFYRRFREERGQNAIAEYRDAAQEMLQSPIS